MTIRGIAKDLYRLQQEVESLVKEFDTTPQEKKADVERRLKRAKAERNRLRRILDGQLDR